MVVMPMSDNIGMHFSVDVETDGDMPGLSSMLSIGVVSMHPVTNVRRKSFYATLERLPDATPSTETMEWWDKYPKQYLDARKGKQPPKVVMGNLRDFVVGELAAMGLDLQPPKPLVPVFMAAPVSFDSAFVYYYLHRFLGSNIFGFRALDLRSLTMGILGTSFLDARPEGYPDEWSTTLEHTHHALDDALAQADVFRRVMDTLRTRAPQNFPLLHENPWMAHT